MNNEQCLHELWSEDHDGHHGHGWVCKNCGARSAIAPWVLSSYKKVGDNK